jgi:hypothetical protein
MKYPQVMQYNIPCIVPLTDDIDLDRVEAALQTIFAARKELKTRFLIDENGEPRQYVDEGKKLNVVRRETTFTALSTPSWASTISTVKAMVISQKTVYQ